MKFFFTLFSLSIFSLAFSQSSRFAVNQKSVLIGEPIELSLTVVYSSKSSLKISEKWDTLPVRFKTKKGEIVDAGDKFEITNWTKNTKRLGDSIEWIGIAKAVLWDSGTFVLPAIAYKVDSKNFVSDSLMLDCKLAEKIKGKDIYEIRDSFIDVESAEKKAKEDSNKLFYVGVIAVVLIIFLLIYFMIRRVKKKARETSASELTLSDRALLAINELEKLQLWKAERHKDHFVELSFILRSYLSSTFELYLLEKTTEETLLLLKQKNVSIMQIKSIEFILKHADMVKFAKSILEENYILDLDNQARNCVKNAEEK